MDSQSEDNLFFKDALRKLQDQIASLQNQVEVQSHQIKNQDDQLKTQDDQLKAQGQQLKTQGHQLKTQSRLIETQKEEIAKLKHQALLSLSNIKVWDEFTRSSSLLADFSPIFDGKGISFSVDETTFYSTVKELTPGFVPNAETREKSIQTSMNTIFSFIISNYFNHLQYHSQPQLFDPKYIPDFVITKKEVSQPVWEDVVIVGELKKLCEQRSGCGQLVKYLHAANHRQRQRSKLVGIYSDFDSITVVVFDSTPNQNFRSSNLKFMSGTSVTEGFQLLLKILSSSLFSLGFNAVTDVKVDGVTIPVSQVLGQGSHHRVYEIIRGNQKAALKVPLVESTSLVSQKERKIVDKIRVLLSKADLDSTFLPVIEKYCLEVTHCIVISPVGTRLREFIQKEKEANQCSYPLSTLNLLVQWVDAITSLFKVGYFHGDVRPQNAVVVPDETEGCREWKLLLIDWETTIPVGELVEVLHGCDAFLADDLLGSFTEGIQYRLVFEFESLVYTIYYLFMDHLNLPWVKNLSGVDPYLQLKLSRKDHFMTLPHSSLEKSLYNIVKNGQEDDIMKNQFIECIKNYM